MHKASYILVTRELEALIFCKRQKHLIPTLWNFNKESVIGILFHLQSVPLYTLLVKISMTESDEIFAK